MNFYPVSARDCGGSRAPRATHDNFPSNFIGNVDMPKKQPQEVKLADTGKRDERGGIGNDNHSLSLSAVAWSSSAPCSSMWVAQACRSMWQAPGRVSPVCFNQAATMRDTTSGLNVSP